jgi:MoxR-like ATPase
MKKIHDKFYAIEQELNRIFVERNETIRGIILATLAKTNILLLGPAGVAKSALIKQWNRRIKNAVYFEWLLTKFSTPEELFGPPSFKAIENDQYRRVTSGKLSDESTNTAFIDEIFKANSSILNSMLTILNERIFYNDGAPTKLNLFTIAGASNEVPETDDNLDAFFDRFLLKYHIEYIKEDGNFARMLENDLDAEPENFITKQEILEAQEAIKTIKFSNEMMQIYIKMRKTLSTESFHVSDRTYKLVINLLKAQAWLSGRESVDTPDFEILKHVVWTLPDQKKRAQGLILDIIAPEKKRILELLENCRETYANVLTKKQSKERHNEAMEALHKLKDASKEIEKLKNIMVQRGASLEDVDAAEKEIESRRKSLLVDEIGVGKALGLTT